MAIWDRLSSFIFGGAVASAAAEGVKPVLEPVRQHAWQRNPLRVLDPGSVARLQAQGLVSAANAEDEASREGYGANRLTALTQLALRAPDVGELLSLIRRSEVTDAQVEHALRKAQYEPQWDAPLKSLAVAPLDPGEIAKAIHRGIMVGPDLQLMNPPTTPGMVDIIPPSTIDPVTEASWWGFDHERTRVLTALAGLPLSLGEMLQLLNRGKVTTDDVQRSIAESNVRNEYMDVALDLRRRLLTPHEYAELWLRGWLDEKERDAGAGLSGMEPGDTALLADMMGRPLAVHQITTGLARGGEYGGTYDDVPEPYRDAIRRSNIRPEWARLAYANRYSYPSAFVLRSLVQSGELDAADGLQTLLDIGWPPELAKKVADAWGGTGSAAADPHVKKAQTQLWTAIHKSYVDDLATDAQATSDLLAAGVASSAVPQILKLWQTERAIARRTLSPTQIRKAIGQPGHDEAWALERLTELGYSTDDATTFLAE